jgi:hypothetical protein
VRWTLALAALSAAAPIAAQDRDPAPDRTIDAAERRTVIDGVIDRLNEAYVFPDTAAAMERALRERQRRGEYDRITSAREFADSLTAHLQAVSKDRHLRVRFAARGVLRGFGGEDDVGRPMNVGFARVERLPGNVGYLEIRSFAFDTADVSSVVAIAFDYLGNTDALIIDVRRNGGGSPYVVAQVSSYLFGPEPVLLNSLYWRPDNRTDDFYTSRTVPGTRYGPDRPVYVLTSRATFSGAEEFTYDLQTRKRATVVGDTTGGGAHPGGPRRVTDYFTVWVPSGRAVNPITNTNWERVGVLPDIAVPSDSALPAAHLAALRELRRRASEREHN